jgi:hypothetical protein
MVSFLQEGLFYYQFLLGGITNTIATQERLSESTFLKKLQEGGGGSRKGFQGNMTFELNAHSKDS